MLDEPVDALCEGVVDEELVLGAASSLHFIDKVLLVIGTSNLTVSELNLHLTAADGGPVEIDRAIG